MTQFLCFASGPEHCVNRAGVQGPNVDVEAAADCGDFFSVVGFVCHYGAGSAGKKGVGHVVDGNIVSDVVDKGRGFADVIKIFPEQNVSSFREAVYFVKGE